MNNIENHEDIQTKCSELDKQDGETPLIVYYISAARDTFKLKCSDVSWRSLTAGQKYRMVQHGNIFTSEQEVEDELKRIFTKP